MPIFSPVTPAQAMGRAPENLSAEERETLSGKFIALEIYTPKTLPLRTIEAVGDSTEDCIRQLAARGLDPRKFEFIRLQPPY